MIEQRTYALPEREADGDAGPPRRDPVAARRRDVRAEAREPVHDADGEEDASIRYVGTGTPHHFPFARLLTQSFAIDVEAAPPPPQANARPRNRNWVAIVPTIALIPIPTISTAFEQAAGGADHSANVTAPAVDQSWREPERQRLPAQRGDAADREIEPAADHHEREPGGHDPAVGDRDADVREVRAVEEVRRLAACRRGRARRSRRSAPPGRRRGRVGRRGLARCSERRCSLPPARAYGIAPTTACHLPQRFPQ